MDGFSGQNVIVQSVDEPYPKHDAFGLQDMARVLRRRQMLLWGVFAAVLAAGVLYAFLRPAEYQSTALLLMSPTAPDTSSAQSQAKAEPDDGYVASQVEILRSPALALRVVDRLHLTTDSEWGAGGRDTASRRNHTASAVAQALDAERRGGTYIVEVRARSRDPQKAERMANAAVDSYFASRDDARAQHSTQTAQWLSTRVQELRHEVQAREAEVEQYRATNGLLAVQGDTLTEQQLRDGEATLTAARADLAEREARYQQVQSMLAQGGSGDTVSGALTSDVMAQLRARQADVTRRLADFSERYGDRHPSIQSARAEAADINRQIAAEVGRIAQNLRDEAQVSRARLASLSAHQAATRNLLAGNNTETVQLRELERNAAAARTVYENFLQRYEELVDNAGGGLGGDAQIVARASTPIDPISRSPLLVILLAAALGLIIGALTVFLVEQFTTTLQTAEDVEQKVGAPLLTSIPHLPSTSYRRLDSTQQHPAGFLVAKPLSAFAEAIRMLRARIVHSGALGEVKSVAVTSAVAGEGKSSMALCLARVSALSGRRAIVVDCDLRRRSLNHLLSIDPYVGIVQVLRGEVNWEAAAGRDEESGAHILPAAGDCMTPEDLFNSDAMRRLLSELSQAYDLVILDCAPILALAEVRDVASLADGVVIVARQNKTPVVALQTALHELRSVGAKVLGVALNGIDIRSPGRFTYADPIYFTHAQKGMYL